MHGLGVKCRKSDVSSIFLKRRDCSLSLWVPLLRAAFPLTQGIFDAENQKGKGAILKKGSRQAVHAVCELDMAHDVPRGHMDVAIQAATHVWTSQFHQVLPFFCATFSENSFTWTAVGAADYASAARRRRATAPSVAVPRTDDCRHSPLRSLPPHGVGACSAEEGVGGRKIFSPKGTVDGEGRGAQRPTGTEEGRREGGPDRLPGAHSEVGGGAHRRCVSAPGFW